VPFFQVACGISERPPQIDEIDLPDVNNQLAVVEYVEDLYTFYKQQQVSLIFNS
jgi:G2/mitotic-specific cyclin-B, other